MEKSKKEFEIPSVLLQHIIDETKAMGIVVVAYREGQGTAVAVRGSLNPMGLINLIHGCEEAGNTLSSTLGKDVANFIKEDI